MWNYVKRYFPLFICAAFFMAGDVIMDLIQPSLMKRIVDDGVLSLENGGGLEFILRLGLLMIGLVLVGGLCGSLNNMFVHVASHNVGNDMRKDAFQRIMHFSFPQMDHFGTGSLVTRVTNDITQVENYVGQFVRGIIRASLLAGGSIWFLFRLNRQFGWIVLAAFPFLLAGMILCLWRIFPLLPSLQARLDEVNALMQEDISAIRVIQAFVREDHEKRRFAQANDALTGTHLRVLKLFALMNPTMNSLMYAVMVLILFSGAAQVETGSATPGAIMAAISYVTQLLNSILMLSLMFQNITRGAASWKRVREILETAPEQQDGAFAGSGETPGGEIRFEHVSFAFPGSKYTVLRDVDLVIHPGETVAVVGATGCGKTALVNLIPRFYDVTEGAVLVDGVDVRDYRQQELRDKIAIVLQKSELFSASIEENIAWGKPGASKEDIHAAAQIAQAEPFILASPDGYATPVAERGMSLSGGQKQRLSIARAVVKPAEILIFDDASSALDLKTEADLYAALDAARPGCTKLIVAQRVASVRRAERIVVLGEGGIEASGTHEELLATCRSYRDICFSQMGEEAYSHA